MSVHVQLGLTHKDVCQNKFITWRSRIASQHGEFHGNCHEKRYIMAARTPFHPSRLSAWEFSEGSIPSTPSWWWVSDMTSSLIFHIYDAHSASSARWVIFFLWPARIWCQLYALLNDVLRNMTVCRFINTKTKSENVWRFVPPNRWAAVSLKVEVVYCLRFFCF